MGQTNFSRLKAGQRAHLAVPNVEAAVHGVRNSGPMTRHPATNTNNHERMETE